MRQLKWLSLLGLLLLGPSAYAQSVRYQSQAISSRGAGIANATIAVCSQPAVTTTQPCSPLATLATSTSTTSGGANPLTADSFGNFFFYAAPGRYTVQIYGPAVFGQFVIPDVEVQASSPIQHSQFFSSSGTFTIPGGVTSVKVTVLGAGGAGGGSDGTHTGTGGGSGGVGIKWLSGLTPGNTLTVTIGTGGTGVSAANGNAGGASSVASGTQTITTITTNGGAGGTANASSVGGGASGGAAGTGGDLNFAGNAGDSFWSPGVGAAGAPSIFGGHTISVIGQAGANNSVSGAGGGGGQGTGPFAGGSGANGIVIFEWVQ